MKSFLFSVLTLSVLGLTAHADTLKCEFASEPFVAVNFDSATSELSVVDFGQAKEITQKISGVSLRTLTDGNLALVSGQQKILMTLSQDGKGSDGRTNFIYPYSAEAQISEKAQGSGACESNLLQAEKPETSEAEM